MSSNKKEKLNATDMANKFINLYPNLKIFLELLVMDHNVKINQVGKKFYYPISIEKNNLHTNYGIFMDYFIRKHLSNQYKTKLIDDVTERVLNNSSEYFKGPGENHQLQLDMSKHYTIFKDSQQQAMDILDSIRIVSLAYTMSFYDPLPRAKVEWNKDNLREIIKYFQKLPYSSVDMKANVECEYFDGNADLIFDGKILYEIKTSKYESLKRCDNKIHVRNFYKLILYGFGYYKKTNKIIQCFKIYNPLLGLEYTLQLDDIDMKHFEEVLKKDTENIGKKKT